MLPALLIPALIAAAGAAGGQTLESLPTILGNDYDKYNKQRIRELQALADRNMLGLSGADQELLKKQGLSQISKSLGDARAFNPTLSNVSAGQAYLRNLEQATKQAQARSQGVQALNAQIRQEDYTREQQQRAELDQRLQAKAQRNQERLAAALAIPAQGLSAGSSQLALSKLTTAPKLPKDLEQMQDIYEQDPAFKEYIDLLMNESSLA